jgi:hypothetical protein
MNMNMNLKYLEEKAVTGRLAMPTELWHAQAWESASISDPFEFFFGD